MVRNTTGLLAGSCNNRISSCVCSCERTFKKRLRSDRNPNFGDLNRHRKAVSIRWHANAKGKPELTRGLRLYADDRTPTLRCDGVQNLVNLSSGDTVTVVGATVGECQCLQHVSHVARWITVCTGVLVDVTHQPTEGTINDAVQILSIRARFIPSGKGSVTASKRRLKVQAISRVRL
jgi:hypothetical protein